MPLLPFPGLLQNVQRTEIKKEGVFHGKVLEYNLS